MFPNDTTSSGISMIETLLVVGLIVILVGVSVPFYYGYEVKTEIDMSVLLTANSLRRAQLLAQGMSGDSAWGVQISPGAITIFQGQSFATRNTNADEVAPLPASVAASGATEQIFSKSDGFPSQPGTILFQAPGGNERSLSINSLGTVNY